MDPYNQGRQESEKNQANYVVAALRSGGGTRIGYSQNRNDTSVLGTLGDLEKLTSGQCFKTQSENAISAFVHFQSLRRLKMAGHPWPARAP
jgi:hypothetical protein